MWKAKHHTILFSTIALCVVLTFEACSPMQSAMDETMGASNICSTMYDPPASLTSKPGAEEPITYVFDKQKVHLESKINGKAQKLQGTKIVVDIDMTCESAADSLSEHVKTQNVDETSTLSSHAFEYIVAEDIDVPALVTLAESDRCIKGITHDAEIKVTGLILPASNDLNIANQTQLSTINYNHAYEYMVKNFDNSTYAKVAFVDTGVDCSHTDIVANLISTCGYDATGNGGPSDVDGHGTHTLGIVGAVTNNGKGVLGLAGNTAKLMAIKTIHQSSGTIADTAEGIQYAISQNQDVINLSIESPSSLPLIEQRVQEAVTAGIVVVIAAGNSGSEITSSFVVSPANVGHTINGAITVASVNSDSHLLSYFSNYGSQVEIAAPGSLTDSTSTNKAGLYSTGLNSSYLRMMGTSQAAPIITGAATLLIQFFKQRGVSYTPASIENIIKASTDINTSVNIQGNRVINFSKLTRNAYAVAGIDLCPKTTTTSSK